MKWSPEHRAAMIIVWLAILVGTFALAELVYLAYLAWG